MRLSKSDFSAILDRHGMKVPDLTQAIYHETKITIKPHTIHSYQSQEGRLSKQMTVIIDLFFKLTAERKKHV